jgi:hypothetical protein
VPDDEKVTLVDCVTVTQQLLYIEYAPASLPEPQAERPAPGLIV